jgi:hypothetical protein
MSGMRVVILGLALAVAGCGGKKAPKAEDQRTASGQILPGTISDAMIAYDALSSTPPMAPRAAAAAAAVVAQSGEEEPQAPAPDAEAPAPAGN